MSQIGQAKPASLIRPSAFILPFRVSMEKSLDRKLRPSTPTRRVASSSSPTPRTPTWRSAWAPGSSPEMHAAKSVSRRSRNIAQQIEVIRGRPGRHHADVGQLQPRLDLSPSGCLTTRRSLRRSGPMTRPISTWPEVQVTPRGSRHGRSAPPQHRPYPVWTPGLCSPRAY